jgi:hypothetical protein
MRIVYLAVAFIFVISAMAVSFGEQDAQPHRRQDGSQDQSPNFYIGQFQGRLKYYVKYGQRYREMGNAQMRYALHNHSQRQNRQDYAADADAREPADLAEHDERRGKQQKRAPNHI